MAQPQLFAGVLLVVHRHGEGQVALHAVQHGDAAGQDLHSTGGQLVVQRLARTGPHLSCHLQHGFAAQVLGHGKGLSPQIGIHRDLHRAGAIPQVDKDHAAMVAASVHPAAQLHLLIDVLFAQVAATVAAHGSFSRGQASFPQLRTGGRRGV